MRSEPASASCWTSSAILGLGPDAAERARESRRESANPPQTVDKTCANFQYPQSTPLEKQSIESLKLSFLEKVLDGNRRG